MRTHKKTIYDALPIVAAAYGEKFGVKVEVGDKSAYTDGNTIVIPNVSTDFNMDVVWGYLAHEAAHVRFTEFIDRPNNLYGDLLNILEDTRIERKIVSVYPGTSVTLNSVAEYMASQGHYAMLNENSHPAQIVAGFCLYYLQYHYMGQAVLEPYLDAANNVIQGILQTTSIGKLRSILDTVATTASTVECSNLAKDIIALLEHEIDSQGQDDSQNQGDSQGQDDSQNQGDSQGQDSSQNQGDSQGQDGSQNQGDSQGQDGSQNQGDSQGQDSSQNQSNSHLIQLALSAKNEDLYGDIQERLKVELEERSSRDVQYRRSNQPEEAQPCFKGQRLKSVVSNESKRIRQQLLGLIQAKNYTGKQLKNKGKHLDVTRLSRITSGNYKVFSRSSERTQPNTAIHILVDMSSSMRRQGTNVSKARFEIAQEAALALSLALDSINGVQVAVTYFYDGVDKNCLRSIVKYGQSVRQKADCFYCTPKGGTPLAEAIWYAAHQLTTVKQERKIILVITDGEPNCADSSQKVITLGENSGMEFIGVGISSPSVFRYFKNSINIHDIAELRATLFSLMENALAA